MEGLLSGLSTTTLDSKSQNLLWWISHEQKASHAPPIILRQTVIDPTPAHKFLGVYFDQELRWHCHVDYVVSKASRWISLFKRITRSRSGLPLQLLRGLYIAVAVPKITYAADVWYSHNGKVFARDVTQSDMKLSYSRESRQTVRMTILILRGEASCLMYSLDTTRHRLNKGIDETDIDFLPLLL